MELAGCVALVTGAARRVGKAIALDLAAAGADVCVHYGKSADEARQVVAQIESSGVRSHAVQADLADPDQIGYLLTAAERRFGRLDVLVNSAAMFQPRKLSAITPDEWDRVLAVNLRAPFLLLQGAARLMEAAQRLGDAPALVVNIADLSGIHAWRGFAHHGVSKAGLLHLTRLAARELAPRIRVNAVVPGAILPPPGMDPGSDAWRKIGEAGLLKRSGEPSQVAQAIRFLATNDYVTGAVIHVDGGEQLMGPWQH